ncbi:MAG: SDR family oxidoreductase [Anaerolineae bacterium]|nr:SDR family oxidoreductase [Anaerolineae bacterium]
MQNKICLVTGATSGIGLETAKQLARLGATVIIVGRDAMRSATAVAQIRQHSGNANVEFLVADLSAQAQVRTLAEQFRRRYARLDVLINNAGVAMMRRQESVDGIEMTFATNVLAPFILTHDLLDVLKASAPSRIINVGSTLHKNAKFDWDDVQMKRKYDGLMAYNNSKLALLWFTYELARRLQGTGVTVNALHPGAVRTNLIARNGWFYKWIVNPIFSLQAISAEQGAQTSVYLASSPEVEGVTGKYFGKCKPRESSPASYDEEAQKRLWRLCEEMTGMCLGASR